jgi:hypothetical protein
MEKDCNRIMKTYHRKIRGMHRFRIQIRRAKESIRLWKEKEKNNNNLILYCPFAVLAFWVIFLRCFWRGYVRIWKYSSFYSKLV